jgi:hypothetical protein
MSKPTSLRVEYHVKAVSKAQREKEEEEERKRKEEKERKRKEKKEKIGNKPKLPFEDEGSSDDEGTGDEDEDDKENTQTSGDVVDLSSSPEEEAAMKVDEKELPSLEDLSKKLIPTKFDSKFLKRSRIMGTILADTKTPFPRAEDSIEKRLEIIPIFKKDGIDRGTDFERSCSFIAYFTKFYSPDQSLSLFTSLFRKLFSKDSSYGEAEADIYDLLSYSTHYPYVFKAFEIVLTEALANFDESIFEKLMYGNYLIRNDEESFTELFDALIFKIHASAYHVFVRECEEEGISYTPIKDLIRKEGDTYYLRPFDETLNNITTDTIRENDRFQKIRTLLSISNFLETFFERLKEKK